MIWSDMTIFSVDGILFYNLIFMFIWLIFVLLVQEKQPYVSKAAQKKTEYDKTLAAYKQKQVCGCKVSPLKLLLHTLSTYGPQCFGDCH